MHFLSCIHQLSVNSRLAIEKCDSVCGDLIMKMPSVDNWLIDTYLGLQGPTQRGTFIEENIVTDLLP